MELVIKGARLLVKNGDRKSELTDGKLVVDLEKKAIVYGKKTISLEAVEKEKSIHYLWVQVFSTDGNITFSGNMLEYKRKKKAKKQSNSLL